jgi:hypothetical protein
LLTAPTFGNTSEHTPAKNGIVSVWAVFLFFTLMNGSKQIKTNQNKTKPNTTKT